MLPLFISFRRVRVPRGVRSLATVEDELRALLRAAELRIKTAEALAASEAARATREAALAASEAARATREGERADSETAKRKSGEKDKFLTDMRSMSTVSAADTRSMVSYIRHGAPSPQVVSVASLLQGFPDDDGTSAGLWQRFLDTRPDAPPRATADAPLKERQGMHPTVKALLALAVPHKRLRIWHEKLTLDDAKGAHIAPDFSLISARDAGPSLIGSLVCIEVKLPGDIEASVHQVCAYLRRRMYKLCQEADDRGEAMDGIEAFGVALDGWSVVLLRMGSGAPALGGSFADAEPCPVQRTPALPLKLQEWLLLQKEPGKRGGKVGGEGVEKGEEGEEKEEREKGEPKSELHPLAGLAALRRLLNAPSSVLGEYALPLETLGVTLHGSAEVGEVGHRSTLQWGKGGQQQHQLLLLLGSRLGSGGNSDVYECQYLPDDSRMAAVAGVPPPLAAVKVARRSTEDVLRGFEAERRALAALALGSAPSEGLVPHCLGFGARERTSVGVGEPPLVTARSKVGRDYSWPVLVLHPAGKPLEHWVGGCEKESVELAESKKEKGDGGESAGATGTAAAAAAAAAARVACADQVLPRVLRALSAAHSTGWVHSDVRPSNVIVTEQGGAMLVDWGAAACTTEREKVWCCVPAFSAEVMLGGNQPLAQPALDGVGALYTWLAIAHGYACTAPWAVSKSFASDDEMAWARREWLRLKAPTDPRVKSVMGALHVLERALKAGGKPLRSKDVLDIVEKALGLGAGGP